jgi:hypothetical protein
MLVNIDRLVSFLFHRGDKIEAHEETLAGILGVQPSKVVS